jgi:hypothetical protein
MPGYIIKQLQKYKCPMPAKPQNCPYTPQPCQYACLGWEISLELHRIPQLFELQTFFVAEFHRKIIFPIVKHVHANSKHFPTISEYFPTINSSDFMHKKKFPLFFNFAHQYYIYILIFQGKPVDIISAGKDIATVFSEILPDASVQTMPLRFG